MGNHTAEALPAMLMAGNGAANALQQNTLLAMTCLQ